MNVERFSKAINDGSVKDNKHLFDYGEKGIDIDGIISRAKKITDTVGAFDLNGHDGEMVIYALGLTLGDALVRFGKTGQTDITQTTIKNWYNIIWTRGDRNVDMYVNFTLGEARAAGRPTTMMRQPKNGATVLRIEQRWVYAAADPKAPSIEGLTTSAAMRVRWLALLFYNIKEKRRFTLSNNITFNVPTKAHETAFEAIAKLLLKDGVGYNIAVSSPKNKRTVVFETLKVAYHPETLRKVGTDLGILSMTSNVKGDDGTYKELVASLFVGGEAAALLKKAKNLPEPSVPSQPEGGSALSAENQNLKQVNAELIEALDTRDAISNSLFDFVAELTNANILTKGQREQLRVFVSTVNDAYGTSVTVDAVFRTEDTNELLHLVGWDMQRVGADYRRVAEALE